MAKRKLHHLHKVKIHHNRWLIWAISYAVIVAIAVVGYVKVSDMQLESESQNIYESWHSYRDNKLGFALRYPANWAIERDSNSSVNFLPHEISDSGVNITVTPVSTESAIRRTLKITKESSVKLDNVAATEIVNDLGSGQKELVIMSKYRNQLYVVRGAESHVNKIVETFYFIK